MKKYQYQINDRVLAFDQGDWTIPGTITDKEPGMYKVEYDYGGYDWLIYDEIKPLEDYVPCTRVAMPRAYANEYKQAWIKYFGELQLMGNLN